MRHKFMISRDDGNHRLTISEYAVTDIDLKKVPSEMLQESSFTRLCEETYEKDRIVRSIARGMNDLIANLRTDNIFPIEPHAVKIAESVAALLDSDDDGAVELLFEDTELVSP